MSLLFHYAIEYRDNFIPQINSDDDFIFSISEISNNYYRDLALIYEQNTLDIYNNLNGDYQIIKEAFIVTIFKKISSFFASLFKIIIGFVKKIINFIKNLFSSDEV